MNDRSAMHQSTAGTDRGGERDPALLGFAESKPSTQHQLSGVTQQIDPTHHVQEAIFHQANQNGKIARPAYRTGINVAISISATPSTIVVPYYGVYFMIRISRVVNRAARSLRALTRVPHKPPTTHQTATERRCPTW